MMHARKRRILGAGAVGLLLAVAVSLAFLFRASTVDNPAIGVLTYQWRWGRVYRISADVNRDGRKDFTATVHSLFGSYSPHTAVPVEAWESSQCDGQFDVHIAFDETGQSSEVEWDSLHTGSYDRSYEGEQATEFLRSLKMDPRCRPNPLSVLDPAKSDPELRP